MRIVVVIISVLLSISSVKGQDWRAAYDSLRSGFVHGDYSFVLSEGDRVLTTIDGASGKDTSYANVLHLVGYSAFLSNDFEKAVDYGNLERDLRAEIEGRDAGTYGYITFLLGLYYTYIGDWDKAADLAGEALILEEKLYGKETPDYINMSLQYASILQQTSRVEETREVFLDLLEDMKHVYQETDSVYSLVMNSAGTFFYTHGMFEEAEPIYLYGLDITKEYYGEESDETIMVYSSVGEFYINAGWPKKAQDIFEEGLAVTQKAKGKPSLDYATGLNNIAVSLEHQGEYEKAIEYYGRSLKMKEDLGYDKIELYALNLANMGVAYDNLGQYEKAKELGEKALKVFVDGGYTNSSNYATSLANLGSTYISLAQYDRALELLEKALGAFERTTGKAGPGYMSALNNMGMLYSEIGQYAKAIETYEEVVRVRRASQGATHPDVASSMMNLANVYDVMGNQSEAEKIIEEALSILEQSVGEKAPEYARGLNTMANHYYSVGNYEEAERLYLKAGKVMKAAFGEVHPDYATQLNNIGLLYLEAGRYKLAEETLLRTIELQKELYDSDHPSNIYSITNLGNVYLSSGKYAKAEEFLKKAMKLAELNHGKDHPNYASQINALATLYYEMGSYDLAEKFYRETIDRYEKIYGKEHKEYSTALSNLGSALLAKASYSIDPNEQLDYAKNALELFRRALHVDTLTLTKDHPDFSYRLNNLAEANRLLGNWDVAKSLYKRSLEIEQKNFGGYYPNSASGYANLALVHIWSRDFDEAKEYAKRSLEIYEKVYGKDHTQSLNALMNTGYAFEQSGDMRGAEDYYLRGLKANYEYINENFAFMSESERSAMLKVNETFTRMFMGFALKRQEMNQDITALAYENILVSKGLLLRSANELKREVERSESAELKSVYDRWLMTKATIAKDLAIPIDQRTHDVDSLQELANDLEKQLVRSISEQKGVDVGVSADWKNVAGSLEDNEAAVEFFQYDLVTEDNVAHDMYGAIILKGAGEPQMVHLFDALDIKEVFKNATGSDSKRVGQLYEDNGLHLYLKIWSPMEEHLEGIEEVYFSPVGLLHKVSFAALKKSDRRLVDHYDLVQVSSTRNVREEEKKERPPSLLIAGGAEYSSEESEQEVWKYLEGTKIEAETIESIAQELSVDVTLLLGQDADESKVKSQSGVASIIHLATHGFFYPDPKKVSAQAEVEVEEDLAFRGGGLGVASFVMNPDPMMRSGLVFSGANDVWSSSEFDGDDGVLTALEVSDLDLGNTDLVVMSACETGLGDVQGAEGVYGLQRAFKLAGADHLIMSLWQVPDKETAEFMTLFYKNYLGGMELGEAFRKTQREMAQEYSPYYWAAFVLVN